MLFSFPSNRWTVVCSICFNTMLNMSQCFSAFTVGSNLKVSDARKISIVGYGLFCLYFFT